MKLFPLVLLLAVSPFSAAATTAKDACEEMKPVAKELQGQTPMDVDYMTTLTGVQTFYASETCFLNYNYVIKTSHLLKEMVEENAMSEEENLAFLKTSEGEAALQNSFDGIAKNSVGRFGALKNISGMTVTYTYSFDDISIQPVRSFVIKN